MIRAALISLAILAPASASALTLAACERVTHTHHAGEDLHRDLGEGRVVWRSWWSNEGTAETLVIADCAEGQALQARTAETGMGDPLPFDRTDRALAAVATSNAGSRAFVTLQALADRLEPVARRTQIAALDTESCACAALYPEARGNRPAFDLMAEQSALFPDTGND